MQILKAALITSAALGGALVLSLFVEPMPEHPGATAGPLPQTPQATPPPATPESDRSGSVGTASALD